MVAQSISEKRERAFVEYVRQGGKVEASDWMPEEYRREVIKIASFQAILEVVPMPMMRRFMYSGPSFRRKRILLAKIQDEIGHCHITCRVLEDLGKTREELFQDYLEGRVRLNYPFHFAVEDWCELPAMLLLTNSAALVQFRSLAHGSYMPYARALRKIAREESFHFYNALEWAHQLVTEGTPSQRSKVQEGLQKWWHIAIYQFGPPEEASAGGRDWRRWRIKVDENEKLRQEWITMLLPIVRSLGVDPDPELRQDPETGQWHYQPLDWDNFFKVIREDRSPYYRWLNEEFRRYLREDLWVREALERAAA